MPGTPRVRAARRQRSHCSSPPSSTGWGRGSRPIPGADRPLPDRGVVAFLAVVPLAVLLLASQFHVQQNSGRRGTSSRELVVDEIGVPVDPDVVSLTVRRVGDANVLRWTDSTTRAPHLLPRVPELASRAASPTWSARLAGVDRCDLRAETLVTTRDHTLRRSRSAGRRGLPGRRRGELARRRHARRRRSRSARLSLHRRRRGSIPTASAASIASSLARSRATSWASSDVVVRQPRQDRRVVEKDGDHEHDRRSEQDGRRVAGHAEPARRSC